MTKYKIDAFVRENLTMAHWIRLSQLCRCKWTRKSQVSGKHASEQYSFFYEHTNVSSCLHPATVPTVGWLSDKFVAPFWLPGIPFLTPGRCILTSRGVILVSWGTICWSGGSQGHPTGHLGGQTWIFNGFWEPLGTNFGSMLVTFSSFGPPNGSTDSIVVFLLIWEQTWHQNATPGCLQNIVNTMVFVRFTV